MHLIKAMIQITDVKKGSIRDYFSMNTEDL